MYCMLKAYVVMQQFVESHICYEQFYVYSLLAYMLYMISPLCFGEQFSVAVIYIDGTLPD